MESKFSQEKGKVIDFIQKKRDGIRGKTSNKKLPKKKQNNNPPKWSIMLQTALVIILIAYFLRQCGL